MALRTLDHVSSQKTELSASVCIVGAGFAGLIAATRLARDKKLRIVVVESGLKTLDPSVSILNEVDNAGDNYDGALLGRSRGLGGTSLLWSGRLLPLSSHDTLPRPYLGLEGWPFDSAELDQYRQEIEALMGVDGEPYDGDIAAEQLDPQSLLPRNDIDFCLRWPKRPSSKNHNVAYVLRKEIERLDNLEIWLGATASQFDFDPDCRKITALTCINLAGKTLRVMANEFLIAAGTLETTRLLLLADRQSNGSISRDCDALGRYFHDHLGWNAATIRPRDNTLTNRMLNDRIWLKSQRHLHFELRPEAQQKHGIGSAYFEIGSGLPDSSALTKTKQVMQQLKRGQMAVNYQDIRAILQDSPSLFWAAQWRLMRKQYYWPANANLHIFIRIEQLPHWHNRIALSDQKDALHLPKLKLEWKKTDADEKVFRVTIETIDRYWKTNLANVCDLEWKPEALNSEVGMVNLTMDLAHPAGSTRMGTNPLDSVVDVNLRVHRIENLSIASASVFPSSGSANPTLTIMHLAMRAADGVARRISDISGTGDYIAMTLKGSGNVASTGSGTIPIAQPWDEAAPDLRPDPDVTLPRLERGSTVLVTGATGFIGGRLVEQLIQQGDVQVRCIVRDVSRTDRLGRLPVELLQMDLRNRDEMVRAVNGVDYVFHCAYDWRSRRQNIDGLRNIIEACASHSVKRLVHVSTFSVYEPLPDGPLTEEFPDGDRASEYVDTKLDLEEIIFAAVRNRQVSAAIVQPTIVYGPYCVPWTISPAESLMFGDVILQDGDEGICSAVYIDDLVDGLILAAVSPAAVGERFLMSGPMPVTWATFFTEMARVLGTKPPQFWSSERIQKQKEQVTSAQKSSKDLIKTIVSPKRLLKAIAGWKPARKVLAAGYDVVPAPLKKMMARHLGSSGNRARGGIFLPQPIYSSKATVGSEKAQSKLGYKPRVDFQRGMELTGRYLKWAYPNVSQSAENPPS
jgi:nucleoside-diphosphate-sugar epimerase/choline dehydrogenase-like flavoprotein